MTTPPVLDRANYTTENPFFDFSANYNVTGTWSFAVPPNGTTGGGGSFDPTANYDGTTNPPITGNWLHNGAFNVQAGTGNVILQSDTGSISLLAPNSGQFARVTASNVAITGSTATTITGATFTGTFTGNASLSASGPLSLSGSSVLVPGLASSAQSNVVQYNTSTGAFSYAPASGFNPALPETITGNWAFNGGFAATSATGNIPLVATAGNVSLTASSGNITLNSPAVNLPALTNVVTANVVYFNSSSGLLSFGAPGAINTALNYTWTGSNNFNGPFAVAAPTGDVSVSATTGSINLVANTAAKSINIQSPTVAVNASTAFSVSAGSSSYNTTGSGALSIGAGGVLSLQGGGGINIPSITSGSAADVLYYNPSTGFVSAAAAPSSGGTTWVNVTGSIQALAKSTAYVAANASLVTFSMPSTAAFGDEFKVVGLGSGGWTISCNVGQTLSLGNISSTSGGNVASTNAKDTVSFVCVVANTTFECYGTVGNINFT